MALAHVEFDATDESGSLLSNMQARVELEGGGLVSIYSDRAGSTPYSNPQTFADGKISFYVAGGAYKITLTSGSFSRVLRYKANGLLAESDALAAAQVEFSPAGGLLSTNVQDAIEEAAASGGGGGRDMLDANETLYVGFDMGSVAISIASPGVVTKTSHGLVADSRVSFAILPYTKASTVTIASPGVVTRTAHGWAAGQPFKFKTTGALPTGITAGTTYYVIATGLTTDTLRFSTTVGGAAVNTSGTQSGSHFTEAAGTLPTGITAGQDYYVLSTGLTANTFQFSATSGGAAINTSGSTVGTINAKTGSDANDGSAASISGAFLTIEKARQAFYAKDLSGFAPTVQLADGQYPAGLICAGKVPGQISPITLQGNAAFDDAVVLAPPSANGLVAEDGAWVHGKYLKFATPGGVGVIAGDGAHVELTSPVFGAASTYHLNTLYSAHLEIHGSYRIEGGGVGHGHITSESGVTWETGTIYVTGVPVFSSFFLGMSSNSNGEYQSVTFDGTATGPKALIHDGATLFASGKDLDYLPGSTSMRVYGGGAYNDWSEPYYAYQVHASDFALADVNTSQPLFSGATDALAFSASETYLVEGEFLITRSAGTTSHTITLAWGGALGTGGSAKWTYWVSNPTGNVLANVQEITSVDLADAVLTAANTSATENLRLRFRGIWRAGTTSSLVQPNIRYSAAPGGVPTVAKGSWMRATKLGKSNIGAVGNWS